MHDAPTCTDRNGPFTFSEVDIGRAGQSLGLETMRGALLGLVFTHGPTALGVYRYVGAGAAMAHTQSTTLGDLVLAYLNGRIARGEITRASARPARYALISFARSFGQRPLGRIARRDVERWLETLDGRSPAYRRNQFSHVRGFCAWLVQSGRVRKDPCIGIRRPTQPRTVPRALRHDAVGQLLAACPDSRARLIALLMVQAGLRRCEVVRLELGDIDQPARIMRVVGKGDHERILPIPDELHDALVAYLGDYPAGAGPLIRSYQYPTRALSPGTVGRIMSDLLHEAGVKRAARDGISGHALRHTFATDVLRAGAHVRDVQHALGHAQLSTTEVYLPHVVHGLADAMEGRRYSSTPQPVDKRRQQFRVLHERWAQKYGEAAG